MRKISRSFCCCFAIVGDGNFVDAIPFPLLGCQRERIVARIPCQHISSRSVACSANIRQKSANPHTRTQHSTECDSELKDGREKLLRINSNQMEVDAAFLFFAIQTNLLRLIEIFANHVYCWRRWRLIAACACVPCGYGDLCSAVISLDFDWIAFSHIFAPLTPNAALVYVHASHLFMNGIAYQSGLVACLIQ